MSKIDLHIHSCFSDDGELSPQAIMAQAMADGMELVAITDHNSVRGVAEARQAAKDLRVVSGVELDCCFGGRNFHLLGYGFDERRSEFAQIEQDIITQMQAAAAQTIDLFCKATGIILDADEILSVAPNGVVGGELIAETLLAREDAHRQPLLAPYLPGGEKSDMPNVHFYWDFFAEGKPAYVPIRYLPLPDATALVHSAGGIAVLAHPGQNLKGNESLLGGIIAERIDGLEVFSSYHDRAASEHYLEVALQNKLLVTCGSDFHGKHKPKIQLGGHGAFLSDEQLLAGINARM